MGFYAARKFHWCAAFDTHKNKKRCNSLMFTIHYLMRYHRISLQMV